MKEWYQRLGARDRVVVHLLAVLVIITLAYLSIVEPLLERRAAAEVRLASQRELLDWMRQSAVEVEQLRASGAGERVADDDRPAYLLLDEAIRGSGLPAPSRIEPQGGGTQAQFESVSFDRLVRLLDRLAQQRGLEVTQASLTAKGQGEVAARVTLERETP